MAHFKDRWNENVIGKYYVDEQCLDCGLCRETAPTVFMRCDYGGYSYVFRQPETVEEKEACVQSLEGCPCEAVGDDGDVNDWTVPKTPLGPPLSFWGWVRQWLFSRR